MGRIHPTHSLPATLAPRSPQPPRTKPRRPRPPSERPVGRVAGGDWGSFPPDPGRCVKVVASGFWTTDGQGCTPMGGDEVDTRMGANGTQMAANSGWGSSSRMDRADPVPWFQWVLMPFGIYLRSPLFLCLPCLPWAAPDSLRLWERDFGFQREWERMIREWPRIRTEERNSGKSCFPYPC